MTRGELILQTASKEIGYHEGKGKHNKYGAWYGLDGEPWCMEFVQWVYHEAGFDLPFKTASCGTLLRWYREHQPECVTDKPVRGCIVIFDWPGTAYSTDHTGIFSRLEGNEITTVDGNTSGGNDSNGGWVQQRTRKVSYANPTYIVPRGLKENIVDIDKLIDDISDEQAYKLYSKAVRHMTSLPLPVSWDAAGELHEAMSLGITDGMHPMCPASRLETAIMVKRGVLK